MKAILVMEMPKYCIDCPCHFAGMSTVVCGVNKKKLMADDIETYKPDWCPLKPAPQKQDICGKYNSEYYAQGGKPASYKIGYNACIDEILGDKE